MPASVEAGTVEEALAPQQAAEPIQSFRLDFGWTVEAIPKPAGEEEEEEAPPEVSFHCLMLDIQGEEVQQVSSASKEAEGVTVPPEPEVAPAEEEAEGAAEEEPAAEAEAEEEKPEEEKPEEEKAEGDEAEEGEKAEGEGMEGTEPLEGSTDGPALALEDEALQPVAPQAAQPAVTRGTMEPSTDFVFPQKDAVIISLPGLPQAVQSVLVLVSSFGATGFRRVGSVQLRITPEAATLPGAEDPEGEAEAEEEAPPKKLPPPVKPQEPCAWMKLDKKLLYHSPAPKAEAVAGKGAPLPKAAPPAPQPSAVLLCKLYKEPTSGAAAQWRLQSATSSFPSLGAFVGDKGAAKDALAKILAAQKEASTAQKRGAAALEAAAEDEELQGKLREAELARQRAENPWRLQAVGLPIVAASLEEGLPQLQRLANYEGRHNAESKREDACGKALIIHQAPEGAEEDSAVPKGLPDSFIGGYAADRRTGPGLYLFGSGGGYAGSFAASKRSGKGVLILPDGSTYTGKFAKDLFEGKGQYSYPDGSCYIGEWLAGQKHGQGVYWDTAGGCLQGSWEKGKLNGQASYDRQAWRSQGMYKQGLPCGPTSFTSAAVRGAELAPVATSHLLTPGGPTIVHGGTYALPPGLFEEKPKDEEAGDGEAEKALPAFPEYLGLSFKSTPEPLRAAADLVFPPAEAAIPLVLAA